MRGIVVAVGLAMTVLPYGGLRAQELDMTTDTELKYGGSMSFILDLLGISGVQTQRLMVSGPLSTVRTDDIKDGELTNSNIVRYDSGQVNVIDHEDESYFTYNLADFMANGPFQFGAQPPPADYEEPQRNEDGAEYDVSMTIESPGGTKTLLEHLVEQLWVRITATPTKAPEGQSIDSMPIFVMLTEMWIAEDFPGNRVMAEISQEAAGLLSKSIGVDGEAMAQAFTHNPQFANAFEQNQEELEKLRNMPLEKLTAFVSLTPNAEFNPDSALYGSMGEVRIDVADAVASGVANAVTGSISRRLGGFGRRSEPEPPPAAAQPAVQTVMVRIHELVTRFTLGPLATGWNSVPVTYEEKENPFQMNQQN